MNSNQSRYTKRQEVRRELDRKVRKDLVLRILPSPSDVLTIKNGIANNRIAEFGLLKMSKFQLNGLYIESQSSDGNLYETFLSYSIKFKRDKIAFSLLRAGADPFLHEGCMQYTIGVNRCKCCFNTNTTVSRMQQVKKKLNLYPPAYLIWILKLVQHCKYLLKSCHNNMAQITVSCSLCGEIRSDTNSYAFMTFYPCRHIFCNTCFWINVRLLDPLSSVTYQSLSRLHINNTCKATAKDADSTVALERMYSNNACCIVCSQTISLHTDEITDHKNLQSEEKAVVSTSTSPLSLHKLSIQSSINCDDGINKVGNSTKVQHKLPLLLQLPPTECKLSSYLLWKRLPASYQHHCNNVDSTDNSNDSNNTNSKHKKSFSSASATSTTFQAMHLTDIATQQVAACVTQQQRSDKLLLECTACYSSRSNNCSDSTTTVAVDTIGSVRVACEEQQLRCVAALIEAGVNIDEARDECGLTALMLAAWTGLARIVQLLLLAGADASLCDPLGYTALQAATYSGHTEIMKILQSHLQQLDKQQVDNHVTISIASTTTNTILKEAINKDVVLGLLTNATEQRNNNNSCSNSIDALDGIFSVYLRKFKLINRSAVSIMSLLIPSNNIISSNSNKNNNHSNDSNNSNDNISHSNASSENVILKKNQHRHCSSSVTDNHCGVALCIDQCFNEQFLNYLVNIFATLQKQEQLQIDKGGNIDIAANANIDGTSTDDIIRNVSNNDKDKDKTLCPHRTYFCDLNGVVRGTIESVLRQAHAQSNILTTNDSNNENSNNENSSNIITNSDIPSSTTTNAATDVTSLLSSSSLSMSAAVTTSDTLEKESIVLKVFPQLRFLHYANAGSGLAPHVDLSRNNIANTDINHNNIANADINYRLNDHCVNNDDDDDDVNTYCSSVGNTSTTTNNSSSSKYSNDNNVDAIAAISTHTLIVYLSNNHLSEDDDHNNNGGCGGGGGETVLLRSVNTSSSRCSNSSDDDNYNLIASVAPRYGRLLIFPHDCPHAALPITSNHQPKILLRGEVYIGGKTYLN